MIDYVEIRNTSLELLGLIDTAKSIIWETQYFGVGDFEIYTAATQQAVEVLQVGNYVTRVDAEGVGIIEAVKIEFTAQDGRMITASGRLAKSILDRRLISWVSGNGSEPTNFSGNVEERARGLVRNNAIDCYKDKARTVPYTQRNMSILQLGTLKGLPAVTELRQAFNENLLTYTDEFLQQYNYGAKVIRSGNKLSYEVYSGKDCSIGNAQGNQPVIFSEDFDNLTGSVYIYDDTAGKSFALVSGEENADKSRFYVECNESLSGLARRETLIDAGSVKKEVYAETFIGDGVWLTVIDKEGNEIPVKLTGTTVFKLREHAATEIVDVKVDGYAVTYKFDLAAQTITLKDAPEEGLEIVVQYVDVEEYKQQLKEAGNQALAAMIAVESFEGSIDLTNSSFTYGVDFELGDIVTVQDNGINKYIDVRVITATEVQDDNGYQINISFGAV